MSLVSKAFRVAVLISGLAVLAPAQAAPLSYRAELGLGNDNNVLREADNQDSGSFFPYLGEVSWKQPSGESSRYRAQGKIRGKKYSGSVSEGDQFYFDLKGEYERRLTGGSRRLVRLHSLDLRLSGLFQHRNTSYLSRRLGEEITAQGENGTVYLTDRYDARKYQAFGELTYRLLRKTRLIGELELTRRDYLQDYEDAPSIDSLDYDNWNFRFLVEQKLEHDLTMELSYKKSRTDYDSWRARDLDGNKVSGIFQTFKYTTWSAGMQYRPDRTLNLSLDLQFRDREDPFQGYYNYSQWGIRPRAAVQLSDKLRLVVRYSHVHREYEKATIGFNPVRPLRDDTEDLLYLKATFKLNQNGSFYLKYNSDSNEETDPLYTYDRHLVALGYQLKY